MLKNNAPFWSCISKTNNTFADNTEDLETIMSICILLEYSHNYCMTSGILWNYYRDKVSDEENENDNGNNKLNNDETSKSFE